MPQTTMPTRNSPLPSFDNVEWIDGAEIIRVYPAISNLGAFHSEERSSLLKRKEEYVKNITFQEAEKMHGWLRNDDNQINAIPITKKYTQNGFDDKCTLILLGGESSFRNEDVSFEQFVNELRIGHTIISIVPSDMYDEETYIIPYREGNNTDRLVMKETFVGKEYSKTLSFTLKPDSFYKVLIDPNMLPTKIMVKLFLDGNPYDQSVEIEYHVAERALADFYRAWKFISNELRNTIFQTQTRNIPSMRRVHEKSKKHISKKRGLYISHDIPFSCEIECYGKDEKTVAVVAKKLGKEMGICRDRSLTTNTGYPIEIQTPILLGKRGEICIAQLCQTLIDNGFRIDKTCGLHIHLCGSKFNLRDGNVTHGLVRPDSLLNMYLFYRLFDPIIMSFLPSTRRNNRYCASMNTISEHNDRIVQADDIDNAFDIIGSMRSLEQFEMYWYKLPTPDHVRQEKGNRYTPSRYYGANFHSLLKDNHFEVRYHSGTLNYEKIMYWINLHGKIVEKCINGSINGEWLVAVKVSNLSKRRMTEELFNVLELNKDEREYFSERQDTFKHAKPTDEIMINKTKKVEAC